MTIKRTPEFLRGNIRKILTLIVRIGKDDEISYMDFTANRGFNREYISFRMYLTIKKQ